LLAALKTRLGPLAFYWPTADKLAFSFDAAQSASDAEEVDLASDEDEAGDEAWRSGFSSGERQLKALREIADHTQAQVYLLDEWDANLDAANRVEAESLVLALAARAVVVEISHRDRV